MARHIAAKLSVLVPNSCDYFAQNLKTFENSLQSKITEWTAEMKPFQGAELIGYHNEWAYLMDFYGLKMTKFIEPKPGVPPGPQYLEELTQFIRQQSVKGMLQATFFPPEAGEFLNEKTGIKVYSACQNVGELEECADYITTIDLITRKILEIFNS